MARHAPGGSPALPLFDRLRGPGAGAPSDRDGVLRASILREIAVLLNTRLTVPHDALTAPRSTLDYGLPDLSAFASGQPESRDRLARVIEQTIAAFEPRLQAPRVCLSEGSGPEALLVQVAGRIGDQDTTLRLHLSRHAARSDDPVG